MFCKFCGKEIDANATYCSHCGKPQNENEFKKVESFVDSVANKADEETDKVFGELGKAFNQNNSQGGTRFLKTDRSLLVYILLSIVTCGIYDFFFVHSLAKDVNEACNSDSEKTPGAGIFIIMWLIAWAIASFTGVANTVSINALQNAISSQNYVLLLSGYSAMIVPFMIVNIIRGIYPLYWRFKLGNKLQRNGNIYGININENGSTVIIWDIIGILCCCIGSWYALYILIKNTNTLCAAYNNKYILNKDNN